MRVVVMWEDPSEAAAARGLAAALVNLPEQWPVPEALRRNTIRTMVSRYGDPYARRFRAIALNPAQSAPRVYEPPKRVDPPREVPELDL